jgi:ADP-ribosyl-[dinitrogen reductase] hydrolase
VWSCWLMRICNSISNPLFVNYLPVDGGGRLGLTMAPGRCQTNLSGEIRWERDLKVDLARLRDYHRTDLLVCLLEDHELVALGIPSYEEAAARAGIVVRRFTIADGGTPGDGFAELVAEVKDAVELGQSVVIHCAAGLGRAGTVGGCLLRAFGFDSDAAQTILKAARGPRCPENSKQRRYIGEFMEESSGAIHEASHDGVAGAVLGGAIGDAMGHPTEFMNMAQIRETFGPYGVTGFERWWTRDGARFAPYTDDTQMAEQVGRGLVETSRADLDTTMKAIAARFVEWSRNPQGGHRAPGNACLAGCAALASGRNWREGGAPQAGGCGSVMRAYPFGVMFAGDPDKAALWAAEHSRLTHNADDALGACAAMAKGVAFALRGAPNPVVLPAMVGAARDYSPRLARTLLRAWDQAIHRADMDQVFERWLGWSAHDAIAAAVYLIARFPNDPRAAILAGANTPGDSDSIATLAGAVLGARAGLEALPGNWVQDVERSDELQTLSEDLLERSRG